MKAILAIMAAALMAGGAQAGEIVTKQPLPALRGGEAVSGERGSVADAFARLVAMQIVAVEQGTISEARWVSPGGAVVWVSRAIGTARELPGASGGFLRAAGAHVARHKGTYTIGASLASVAGLYAIAANNGWAGLDPHYGRGVATEDDPATGRQVTDAGGDNYSAGGDIYIQHGERREDSDDNG